jgi:hypothetical protein
MPGRPALTEATPEGRAPEGAMAVPAVVESVGSSALLEALDENLWAFWRDYGGAPGAERHEGADLRWFA